ncbi:Uncharacterized protein TCM_012167 [Theobroma cacao]|uniref:Uncharacterized protein n=1 Tax=Theobroma cacao TaxID=3641 RepID=A0A061FUC1_THECC|nr:Uncharacterized protein TCM_012167 [Theobroma cacao]
MGMKENLRQSKANYPNYPCRDLGREKCQNLYIEFGIRRDSPNSQAQCLLWVSDSGFGHILFLHGLWTEMPRTD